MNFYNKANRREKNRVFLSEEKPAFVQFDTKELPILDLGAGGLSFNNENYIAGDWHFANLKLYGQKSNISTVLEIINIDKNNICRCRFKKIQDGAVEVIGRFMTEH